MIYVVALLTGVIFGWILREAVLMMEERDDAS